MGKKLGLGSFLLKLRQAPPPWPSCRQPKTESFRDASVYKTVNSVYFDSAESCFTHPSTSEARESFSAASEEVVVPLRPADRIFFRRSGDTSSILEEAKPVETCDDDDGDAAPPFEGGVALAVNSEDPYRDFRRSMEEMVAAQGLSDWRRLEALLVWYLRVNRKKTHGFIFGAFADLIVALASSPASSSNSFEVAEIKEHESSDSN